MQLKEVLRVRNQEYLAGRGTLDILLETQRFHADALASEANATVAYQQAACRYLHGRGARPARQGVDHLGAATRATRAPRAGGHGAVAGTPKRQVGRLPDDARASPRPLAPFALPGCYAGGAAGGEAAVRAALNAAQHSLAHCWSSASRAESQG
jgi:hypothetical protein